MKNFLLLFTSILFMSCSITEHDNDIYHNYKEIENVDYIDQLRSLDKVYLSSRGIRQFKLSHASKNYLKSLYNKIVSDNELLFTIKEGPIFYIVDARTPFYFSLPGSKFFFSRGLISKYLKQETLLVSVLVFEMIKSLRFLYRKKIFVPVGAIETRGMLAISRVGMTEKVRINEWSYFAMKRAGFDPYAYLLWLQVQNHNLLDFSFQLGSSHYVSNEEYQFKSFLVKHRGEENKTRKYESNSSKSFYRFIKEVKR